LAVFTRAEEVGFIGCTDLLTRKILPENIWFLSLEASKALPEAEMGRGPVLRIGDAWCLFDAEFSSLLWTFAKELAASTEKSENPFRFQRRLMSGGVCEGTPLTIFGFQVAAISVPLLNYHNQGEDGPAQEMISLFDVEGARALCFSLAEKLKEKPDWKSKVKKEILGFHRKLKPHLKAQIPFDGEDLQ
jgi:endoglucanase